MSLLLALGLPLLACCSRIPSAAKARPQSGDQHALAAFGTV